jgi:hypothetical protein
VAAAGCGGSATSKPPPVPFHVNRISLTADSGFPAPATVHASVTKANGKLLVRLEKLVPMPLPAPLTKKIPGVTVCVPVILTIHLGDGRRHVQVQEYRACQRPASLRPLMQAMCPLLRRPAFCDQYRNDLAAKR